MEGRESRRANDIFFVCSLVDYIARKTKNRRSDVVEALGPQRLGRIVELADVYHSDNIDAVSDRFIEEAGHRRRRFRQRRRRPLRRSLPLGYRQGVQAARPRHRRPRGNDRCWGDPARLPFAGQRSHRQLQRQFLLRFARGHLRCLRHGRAGVAVLRLSPGMQYFDKNSLRKNEPNTHGGSMLARVDLLSERGPGFHFGPRTRRGKGSLWERLRKPSARSAAGRFSAWPGQRESVWR